MELLIDLNHKVVADGECGSGTTSSQSKVAQFYCNNDVQILPANMCVAKYIKLKYLGKTGSSLNLDVCIKARNTICNRV